MNDVADIQKGIDILVSLNDIVLGGQLNATLTCTAKAIDITNKINAEWSEYITSIKSWRIDCNGFYCKNDRAYKALQDAFFNNQRVQVSMKLDNQKYTGYAYIIDFPVAATYNNSYKYSARFLGDGELSVDEPPVNGD